MCRLQLSGSDGDYRCLSATIGKSIIYSRYGVDNWSRISSGDGIVDGIDAIINEHHF